MEARKFNRGHGTGGEQQSRKKTQNLNFKYYLKSTCLIKRIAIILPRYIIIFIILSTFNLYNLVSELLREKPYLTLSSGTILYSEIVYAQLKLICKDSNSK